MKNLFTCAFILFSVLTYGQSNIAEVNKITGFYVFTDAEPLSEYEVLGEVTTENHRDASITSSAGQYEPVRNYLVKKARETFYSGAEGVILNLINGSVDKAVVIKFKDGATDKGKARVKQYQGVYVFMDSEPISETNYLGTTKITFGFGSSQYPTLRDRMITRTKRDFPNSKGVILKFVSGGTDTADAFEFKN